MICGSIQRVRRRWTVRSTEVIKYPNQGGNPKNVLNIRVHHSWDWKMWNATCMQLRFQRIFSGIVSIKNLYIAQRIAPCLANRPDMSQGGVPMPIIIRQQADCSDLCMQTFLEIHPALARHDIGHLASKPTELTQICIIPSRTRRSRSGLRKAAGHRPKGSECSLYHAGLHKTRQIQDLDLMDRQVAGTLSLHWNPDD